MQAKSQYKMVQDATGSTESMNDDLFLNLLLLRGEETMEEVET
jgi:hypothetical protein